MIWILAGIALCAREPNLDTHKPSQSTKNAHHAADGTTDGASTGELFQNVTVQPSKPTVLESALDYSKLDKVAVSLTSDADLTNLTIQAQWSFPEAEHWAVVETKSGRTFPFSNTGGAVFQTYGSLFRLVLRSSSDAPLEIQQITLFRRTQ
jgi:hypothetical protein